MEKRTCSKCFETKAKSEFYHGICIACKNKARKVYYEKNKRKVRLYYLRTRGKKINKWVKCGFCLEVFEKEVSRQKYCNPRCRYKARRRSVKGIALFKRNAREQFRTALSKGTIKRLPCIKCGSPKSQGHHEDYSKPLDVIWLCWQHHYELHNLLRPVSCLLNG